MNAKNFPKRLDSKTSYLRITVPENLDLALEGLIRKVLKEQPRIDDIYSFAADYFETLLKIRDKAGAKFKADQLCPFHNDEDAHEMIKIAGTFSKRETEELRRKNEESLPTKTNNVARNKDLDDKVQDKKSVDKSKSKEALKDEVIVEQNKRATSKIVKKVPTEVKNVPEEEKKQTKLANKRSDGIHSERGTKKTESDDEEFLASDPIKELVEKELMETKLGGKRKKMKESTANYMKSPVTSNELTMNKNIQEEQKPADSIKVHSVINDTNGQTEKEDITSKENSAEKEKDNKSRNEEIEEIKVDSSGITEQASEESTPDVKEEKEIKPVNTEASNKRPEDMEGESRESIKGTTDSKSVTNLKIENKEGIKMVEETDRSAENTEEAKITIDRDDVTRIKNPKDENPEAAESEVQTLTQDIQSEEKFNKQSTEMTNETADRTPETPNDVREKEVNQAVYSDTLDENNATDINSNVKGQEEKNVKTSEMIPQNEIKPEEKKSKEPLCDQQTSRVNDRTDVEKETKSLVETVAKDENSESIDGNKKVETLVINVKPADAEPNTMHDTGKIEMNNKQELKAQEEEMDGDEAEPTIKIEAMDITSPNEREAAKEVPYKTEELNSDDSATKVTEQMKEIEQDEPKNTQCILKSDEKLLKSEETTEDKKDKNIIKNDEDNRAEIQEIKTHDTKLTSGQAINTNDTKLESESTVPQVDSKNNFLKGKFNELSSIDKESYQSEDNKSETSSPKLISDTTNLDEVIKSEKKEKLTNEHRVKSTEDSLFGEKTHDFEQSPDNETAQTVEETAVIPQAQRKEISEIQEDEQVNQNAAESRPMNKESVTQEEDNARELEDEVLTSPDQLNINKPREERLDEALKSGTPVTDETQSKDNETESGRERTKGKSENRAEGGSPRIGEDETKREEPSVKYQIPEGDKSSGEKRNEKSKHKFETNGENEEDESKPEEELCTVVDVQQISKDDAIDGNELEEKCEPEPENTRSKENDVKVEERTVEEEREHSIIVEEADQTEENVLPQPSAEMQIKTIQSHIYDTLQVPDTVTREYRVHNVPSPPMGALLNVVSSLQQSQELKQELLNKEDQIEKTVDANMNPTPVGDKVIKVPSSADLTKTATTAENPKFDNLQPADPLKNSETSTTPPENASDQKELESGARKNDSDDLQDVTTPTSDYSLNLSELGWQTINELFLDSEKRNSSLEKEENRCVSQKTSKIAGDSDEVEEIIHKAVVFSCREAVPEPPRDLEANAQTPENVEEKKEEKPEGESAESSSDSGNERISVNDDAPFISVEVKTVIETQILDDDDVDDADENDRVRDKEQNSEGKIPRDVEIKVETTIDFRNEVDITRSDSEPAENKMETAVGTGNGSKSSPETQNKKSHDKPKESSSTERTAGGEDSSAESDSTIPSTATEIKRADFAKRNFSSTRSLLSTQSLDLEKKNSLMKTRSLSTFRHGVTDFEVWNAIEKELEEAATKIQSKFRGYKTRKKLQRENAVQITTEESSGSVTPVEEEIKNGCQRSTGEFHDSIVLSEHPR